MGTAPSGCRGQRGHGSEPLAYRPPGGRDGANGAVEYAPVCCCLKRPATRHLADSMVLTMLVERTLEEPEETSSVSTGRTNNHVDVTRCDRHETPVVKLVS